MTTDNGISNILAWMSQFYDVRRQTLK